MADCLGLQTGLYYIKPTELNKATTINCRSLIPPMRRRLRNKRSINASRYIQFGQLSAGEPQGLNVDSGQYADECAENTSGEPQYVIHPDLLDPSSSVIVHGLDGATAGHLVLVSENGELLLQCDARDFSQQSHNDAQQMSFERSPDEDSHERADTLYVAEDDGGADLTCDLKVLSSAIS